VLRGFCVGLFCCLSVCQRVFTLLSTVGLVFHACSIFVLECKLLARLLSSRLSARVVGFHIYASADASLCARRLACRKLVPFCSFKIVVAIFVVLVSVGCVLWCVGCLEGAVGWLVGGTKVSGSQLVSVCLFGHLCWCWFC